MKREIIAIPEFHNRVSPLLDVARRFILVEYGDGEWQQKQSVEFNGDGGIGTINALNAMGVSLIICDRVSCHLTRMASCRGLRIIPCIQGPVIDVLNRYRDGDMETVTDIFQCRQRGLRGRCRRGETGGRKKFNADEEEGR